MGRLLSFAVGGNANNGANDGIGYANVNVNSGNANWNYGSRPNLSANCRTNAPPPLGENKQNRRRVGRTLEDSLLQEILFKENEMKRVGNLYEKYISLNNCINAVKRLGQNKPHDRMAKYISENAEKFGQILQERIQKDDLRLHEDRIKVIKDYSSGKERRLSIPCLSDQAVEIAWLLASKDLILNRLCYYCCGSMPGRGQARACKYVQKCSNKYKYGALTDISKFYDSIPHWLVMKELRRMIKDEKYLSVAEQILSHMGDGKVGVPIGHPISHWFANISLMSIMHSLETMDVKFVQYMDDVCLFSNNKRHIRKAVMWLRDEYAKVGFHMKTSFQWFPIKNRPIQYLSYRFSKGYCVLKKMLMHRIGRTAKIFAIKRFLRLAQRMMCYYAIMKHCKCYRFRERFVKPFISKKRLRGYISNESKDLLRRRADTVLCG